MDIKNLCLGLDIWVPKLMHSTSTKSGKVDQLRRTNHTPNGSVNRAVQGRTLLYSAIQGQQTLYQSSVKSR